MRQFSATAVARFAAAAVLTATIAATGGCTGDKEAATLNVDSEHAFSVFLGKELGVVDFAQMKIRNECLAKSGYPQLKNTMSSGPKELFTQLTITPRTFGPTSPAEARRIGFGRDLEAEPPVVASFDSTYDKARESCEKVAWERLGKQSLRTYQGYFDLGNSLTKPLMSMVSERISPDVPGKLLSCLEGKGHRVADRTAFLQAPDPRHFGLTFGHVVDGPERSWQPRRVPGTVEVGPAAPPARYQPSPEEGELAVAWLDCRVATGLADQQMKAAVAVQLELVRKHEDTFTELNPQVQELARTAAAVMGKS